MRICIATPASSGSRKGNRITALRWAAHLRACGHRVRIVVQWTDEPADLLVCIHATRSAPSARRWCERRPGAPLVALLAGTDLYRDLGREPACLETLERADRIAALQALAAQRLPERLRGKVRVVHQSSPGLDEPVRRPADRFEVLVVGHLREVKDPFRTAEAARRLPVDSRVRVRHLGAALDDAMRARAEDETRDNPRYRWEGEVPRRRVRAALAGAHLFALTSVLEGGANVLSEAIALGTPAVASRIDGSVGLLGDAYPGYFPVGDTAALAEHLRRAETDSSFYSSLEAACAERAPLFRPERERRVIDELVGEVVGDRRGVST